MSFLVAELFGLKLSNVALSSAADDLAQRASQNHKTKAYFLNAHCVNLAAGSQDYYDALRGADVLYGDGVGVRIAAKLSGEPLVDNVNGTDLFPELCLAAAKKDISIALLGARAGVAKQCAANMESNINGLKVVWHHHGYFDEHDEEIMIEQLNNSGAKILFVAMGVPAQEHWIQRNAGRINVPVILGVGALFDFYSGLVPRAPLIWRKFNMEWLYRFFVEPRRMFGRYILGNPLYLTRTCFLLLCGKERLKRNIHCC